MAQVSPADVLVDYDTLRYAAPPAASLHCPICKNVLLHPVETTCHHVFCGRCITRALNAKRECPADRTPLPNGVGDLTPCSRLLLHLIDELEVVCPSASCERTLPRGLLPYHLAGECAFYEVACVDEACDKTVPRHARLSAVECGHVLVLCEHCGDDIETRNRLAHLDECRELSHECAHCGVELGADDIVAHRQACDDAQVSCEASDVGCDWVGPRRRCTEHETSCVIAKMAPFMRAQQKEQQTDRLRLMALQDVLYSANPYAKHSLSRLRASTHDDDRGAGAATTTSVAAEEPVLEISTEYSRDRGYLFSMLGHQAEALEHLQQSLAGVESRLAVGQQHEAARQRDEMHFARGAIANLTRQVHGIVQQLHHLRLGARYPLGGVFPMPMPPQQQQQQMFGPALQPHPDGTGSSVGTAQAGESLLRQGDVHEQVRSAIASAVSSPNLQSQGQGRSTASSVAATSANNSTPSSPRQRHTPLATGSGGGGGGGGGNGGRSHSETSSRQHVKL